jgi:hypothetical protein
VILSAGLLVSWGLGVSGYVVAHLPWVWKDCEAGGSYCVLEMPSRNAWVAAACWSVGGALVVATALAALRWRRWRLLALAMPALLPLLVVEGSAVERGGRWRLPALLGTASCIFLTASSAIHYLVHAAGSDYGPTWAVVVLFTGWATGLLLGLVGTGFALSRRAWPLVPGNLAPWVVLVVLAVADNWIG